MQSLHCKPITASLVDFGISTLISSRWGLANDLQYVHIYSPLFKTLKVDEIVNSDKLSQVKNSPIKNGLYFLQSEPKQQELRRRQHDEPPELDHHHLTNCVPKQMLINNNVVNNFYQTNDSNSTGHNYLRSLNSGACRLLKRLIN